MKASHAAFFARGRAVGPEADDDEDGDLGAQYVIPKVWTPEHVGVRLIHACKIIEASVSKPGPRATHTAWPEVIGGWRGLLSIEEQAFVIDLERRQRARRKVRGALDPRKIDWRKYVPEDIVRSVETDAAEVAGRKREPALQIDVACAEEALRWPAEFLMDDVLQADALMAWAWTKATGRSLEKLLRARNRRVAAKIDFRVAEITAPREARRKEIAAEVLAWGREQSVGAGEGDRKSILRAMQERLQSAIRAEGLDAPVPDFKPEDVAPGECYTRKAIDTFRAKGGAKIARALHLTRRPVR